LEAALSCGSSEELRIVASITALTSTFAGGGPSKERWRPAGTVCKI